jgi:hypothetical protein
MAHSVKVKNITFEQIENLKYRSREKSKRKIYNQEIIEFAINQIKHCNECMKKFERWVLKGR